MEVAAAVFCGFRKANAMEGMGAACEKDGAVGSLLDLLAAVEGPPSEVTVVVVVVVTFAPALATEGAEELAAAAAVPASPKGEAALMPNGAREVLLQATKCVREVACVRLWRTGRGRERGRKARIGKGE